MVGRASCRMWRGRCRTPADACQAAPRRRSWLAGQLLERFDRARGLTDRGRVPAPEDHQGRTARSGSEEEMSLADVGRVLAAVQFGRDLDRVPDITSKDPLDL